MDTPSSTHIPFTSTLPASKKLVSKMLAICLLFAQDEYYERAGRILLAVCQLIGGQVPTLVHALTGCLSWRTAFRLLKGSNAGIPDYFVDLHNLVPAHHPKSSARSETRVPSTIACTSTLVLH